LIVAKPMGYGLFRTTAHSPMRQLGASTGKEMAPS
jgi:hypothetical protein